MRTFALIAAAAAVAFAAPAMASSDTTNVQINRLTGQIALTNVQSVGVDGRAIVNSQALGNSISMSVDTNSPVTVQNSVRVASAQFNQGTAQVAISNLQGAGIDGRLEIGSTAVGNTGTFESVNGDVDTTLWSRATIGSVLLSQGEVAAAGVVGAWNEGFAFQSNVGTLQAAGTNLQGLSVGGKVDASATAVGNNLEFEAGKNGSAVAFQTNLGTAQLAGLNAQYGSFGGNATFKSQAIGNISSWTSNSSDGINFQSNIGTIQGAVTNVQFSGFGGNLNVGSVSVGNSASIISK